MKSIINYYYNLNPDKINHLYNYYYFYINQELYNFIIYDKDIKLINSIYELNKEMLNKGILVSEIINNRDNTIITYYNKIPHILIKVLININKPITLPEINYISSNNIHYDKYLMRSNWANLWSNKIDYLEYHHEQNYQKYKILSSCFDYFIGLSENAISYLNKTVSTLTPENNDIGVISHDKLTKDDKIYALYNPLNLIIDHKSRDLAEYIKLSFFNDNYQIYDELDEYFKHNYFSKYGIQLLISRILYPSFYYDLYDNVLNKKINESEVLKITSRIPEYEIYLADIFKYFKKYYEIEEITWIKKRGTSPQIKL